MFLGLSKAVVKGHGNSKRTAFSVCIKQASDAVRGDMTGKMKEMLDKVDLDAIAEQAKASEGQA